MTAGGVVKTFRASGPHQVLLLPAPLAPARSGGPAGALRARRTARGSGWPRAPGPRPRSGPGAPGGKEQLVEEVIRTCGPLYGDLVYAILDPYQDLETAITDAFALAAHDLAASDYADACPIATIALEVASTNDHLRQATADVFTGWISRGAVLFVRHGLDEPAARRLTIAMIAALEGAFVLARALRDPEPLHAAGASVATAVRQALDQAADSH